MPRRRSGPRRGVRSGRMPSTRGETIGVLLVAAAFAALVLFLGGSSYLPLLLIPVVAMVVPTAVVVAASAVARALRGRRDDPPRHVAIDPVPHADPEADGVAALLPDHEPEPGPAAVADWRHAHSRFGALRGEYAAHECDPMAVLRLPALTDVSLGSTARFVDAFAEAQALDTDRFPTPTHATAFSAAVRRAERAWVAARDAAERIRLSGLSPTERSTVERVIKLLTTAHRSDSAPERLAAYARARAELTRLDAAGVIHLPRTAAVALDTAARGELPA